MTKTGDTSYALKSPLRGYVKSHVLALVGNGLMDRKQWADTLGVDRRTLYRWEKNIIPKEKELSFQYFWLAPSLLHIDPYQRFVTYLIKLKKDDSVGVNNKEVIAFLLGDNSKRKPLGQFLNRETFRAIRLAEESRKTA